MKELFLETCYERRYISSFVYYFFGACIIFSGVKFVLSLLIKQKRARYSEKMSMNDNKESTPFCRRKNFTRPSSSHHFADLSGILRKWNGSRTTTVREQLGALEALWEIYWRGYKTCKPPAVSVLWKPSWQTGIGSLKRYWERIPEEGSPYMSDCAISHRRFQFNSYRENFIYC